MTLPLDASQIRSFRMQFAQLAVRVFAEQGEEGVTMRALAQASGVSRSTPYSYFADKADILDCIRAAGFRQLADRYVRALEEERDLLLRLRATARAYVTFAADEPALYRLMFDRRAGDRPHNPELQAAVKDFNHIADGPLDDCIAAGLLRGRRDDLKFASWSAFHGLASLFQAGHVPDRRRLEAMVDVVSDTLRYGMLAGGDARRGRKRVTDR